MIIASTSAIRLQFIAGDLSPFPSRLQKILIEHIFIIIAC
jgi:hypothetical protein